MTRLWVLGDSWTDPAFAGRWADGWPTLVAARLGAGLVNSGAAGAGYAQLNGAGINYPIQAARGAGAGADAVIVWGSVNDWTQPPDAVAAAAAATYRLLRAACPGAPLVVYGPQFWADQPPPDLVAVAAAVHAAAADAEATYGDPLLWMRDRPDLIDGSGHPTADGHAHLADRLAPGLLWALSGPPPACRDWSDEGGWGAPYTLGAPAGTDPASPIPSAA
jgi:lysophospholipase L1-like esterase